jgi:UDP-glucose 4-epimerase
MKFLVTGGAGFIGSNLVDELINTGHEVVSIDNESAESNSQFYWNEKAKNYPIDINDFCSLGWVFKHEKPEIVFHLAAEARIQPTVNEPQKACMTNFVGTCNVLQASRENKVKRVIYSSTSSAYGLANHLPLEESMVKDCLNPYSVSKTGGEELCKVYYNIYGLETITLRYFNVYGDREPTRGHYAPVIGLFLRQRREGKPMTIVGDGKQTRDFTHIDDVVNANILASGADNREALGGVFNIGTGKNYSILQIAEMIGGDVEYIAERAGESRSTLANNDKAKKLLNWEPSKDLKNYLKELDNR